MIVMSTQDYTEQIIPTLDSAAINAYIQEAMTDYGVPGLSLAIVDNGELVYAQGYGVRDLRTGEPVTPETQFNIGSITKSFTALAAAQLADAGQLDLDQPIVEYVDGLQFDDPLGQTLTLRDLLSNTAGFAPDDAGWYSGQQDTLADVVAAAQHQPFVGTPGETFAYNNMGYALAGYVIEQVSGQSWADYMTEHVLTPLGMTDATTDFEAMAALPNYAASHVLDVHTGTVPVDFFANMDAIAPAGAINANALEMANYALFQLGDGTFEGEQLLSPELITDMHTPRVQGYGLGWVAQEHEGVELVWHNGSIDGSGALLALVPSEDLGVVVMMNADYTDQSGFLDAMALHTVEVALGLTPEQDILETLQMATGLNPVERQARIDAAAAFTPDVRTYEDVYAGTYHSLILGDIVLTVDDEQLMVTVTIDNYTQTFEFVEFEPGMFMGNLRTVNTGVFELRPNDEGAVVLLQNGFPLATKSAPE